jgi:hypothetical protein
MCVLIFSTTFVWNISHLSRIQRDIVINVKTFSCKVPVIRSKFSGNWISSTDFIKKLRCQISWIRPARAEFFMRTDGQVEANNRFSQFCESALERTLDSRRVLKEPLSESLCFTSWHLREIHEAVLYIFWEKCLECFKLNNILNWMLIVIPPFLIIKTLRVLPKLGWVRWSKCLLCGGSRSHI